MRKRLKILYNFLCKAAFVSVFLFTGTLFSYAKDAQQLGRNEALDELSFVQMLNSVDLGKQSKLIQEFQQKEGRNWLLKKYNPNVCGVEAYRNREVLLVTIPASRLFSPNEVTLRDGAALFLAPLTRYLKEPDMYRVMLVMHTDNTGSEQYRDELTVDRVDAVFEWFEKQGVNTNYLFSYALSDDMPLKPNDSMENRETNRRLEVYLVPGEKMLNQAKNGRISF